MSKIKRNDPCPCGSGKKYKQCCEEKDAQEVRSHQIRYDEPLLVDGESISETEGDIMPAATLAEVTAGELKEERDLVLVRPVTVSDNHFLYASDSEFVVKTFVLSRTTSDGKYAKPEHAAKGYTWYIREADAVGKESVAFFKDVEMALHALDMLHTWEDECEHEGFGLAHDLDDIRRFLAVHNDWHLLESL